MFFKSRPYFMLRFRLPCFITSSLAHRWSNRLPFGAGLSWNYGTIQFILAGRDPLRLGSECVLTTEKVGSNCSAKPRQHLPKRSVFKIS